MYYKPSEKLREEAASCECNNLSGERVFGRLDHLLGRGPNSTMQFNEAKLMYNNNDDDRWLQSKSSEEMSVIIAKASKDQNARFIEEKRHGKKIQELKSLKLSQKQTEIENKAERTRNIRENILEDLQETGGLWSDGETMEKKLNGQSMKKQLHFLKAQIKIRKVILQQTNEKTLLQFTEKRKALSIEKLKANLLCLMSTERDPESVTNYFKILLKQLVKRFLSIFF